MTNLTIFYQQFLNSLANMQEVDSIPEYITSCIQAIGIKIQFEEFTDNEMEVLDYMIKVYSAIGIIDLSMREE